MSAKNERFELEKTSKQDQPPSKTRGIRSFSKVCRGRVVDGCDGSVHVVRLSLCVVVVLFPIYLKWGGYVGNRCIKYKRNEINADVPYTPAYSPVFPFSLRVLLARLCGGGRVLHRARVVWWCASDCDLVTGPVQVQPRFEPEVRSNQSLDLNLPKRVRSTFKLTRTLGPSGSVRFEPRSEVRRTGLWTV